MTDTNKDRPLSLNAARDFLISITLASLFFASLVCLSCKEDIIIIANERVSEKMCDTKRVSKLEPIERRALEENKQKQLLFDDSEAELNFFFILLTKFYFWCSHEHVKKAD
jgi:hypothetical protein